VVLVKEPRERQRSLREVLVWEVREEECGGEWQEELGTWRKVVAGWRCWSLWVVWRFVQKDEMELRWEIWEVFASSLPLVRCLVVTEQKGFADCARRLDINGCSCNPYRKGIVVSGADGKSSESVWSLCLRLSDRIF
jgi:hypothetical protein